MVYKEDISNLVPELYLSTNDIIEAYKDPNDYKEFLQTAANFIQKEPGYFYLEEFLIEKLMDVTHHYRFEHIKEPKLNELINLIIRNSNHIKFNMYNIEYITPILENYVMYQEECRGINFEDDLQLLNSMAQDYTVFYELLHKNGKRINDEAFLISTNYFINYCPEIYKIPDIKTETDKKLKTLLNEKYVRKYIMKEYTKSTIKIFQKLKKEE